MGSILLFDLRNRYIWNWWLFISVQITFPGVSREMFSTILQQESHGCCAEAPVPKQTYGADSFCSLIFRHSIRVRCFYDSCLQICCQFRQSNALFYQFRDICTLWWSIPLLAVKNIPNVAMRNCFVKITLFIMMTFDHCRMAVYAKLYCSLNFTVQYDICSKLYKLPSNRGAKHFCR